MAEDERLTVDALRTWLERKQGDLPVRLSIKREDGDDVLEVIATRVNLLPTVAADLTTTDGEVVIWGWEPDVKLIS